MLRHPRRGRAAHSSSIDAQQLIARLPHGAVNQASRNRTQHHWSGGRVARGGRLPEQGHANLSGGMGSGLQAYLENRLLPADATPSYWPQKPHTLPCAIIPNPEQAAALNARIPRTDGSLSRWSAVVQCCESTECTETRQEPDDSVIVAMTSAPPPHAAKSWLLLAAALSAERGRRRPARFSHLLKLA